MTLMTSALIVGVAVSLSAGVAAADELDGDKILTAADGWPIHITYYSAGTDNKEAPVAILIAGAEGATGPTARTRRVWAKTAEHLKKSGYAVVTVDLRKNGDSVAPAEVSNAALTKIGPNDYAIMAASDLEAVKDFLLQEHQQQRLNIRKTGIVTAGSSCHVAAAFAVADWAKTPYPDGPIPLPGQPDIRTPRGQDVRAIMMFSPPGSVRGINTLNVMKALKAIEVAVYIFASGADRGEARDAERLHRMIELKGDEYSEFRKISLAKEKASGETFLEAPYGDQTNKLIEEFLDKNVDQLDQPWQSRTSRISQ